MSHKTHKIKDPSLFRKVSAEDYNAGENAKGSPVRVADVNGNGRVDTRDIFVANGSHPELNLKPGVHRHLMCMERFEGKTALKIGKRALHNLKAYNPTGELVTKDHPLIGVFIGYLGGREDLTRGPDGYVPLIYVDGRFDKAVEGCSFNKSLTVRGGLSKNILRLTYRNATGRHREVWNLKTGRTRGGS
ncbi:MAG TPA: hypothetical protein VFX30_10060 [bacterium]|nr:hypothetical protein [bacterium]